MKLEQQLSKVFFPFNEKTIEEYTYRTENRSALLPVIEKLFVAPFLALAPKTLTPMLLAVIAFLLSAFAFYISQLYVGRYPTVTFPGIAACTFLYIIIDSAIRPLARKRGDRSHLTDFLQHYFHGFAFGFFSLIAATLFTSDTMNYGPFIIVSVYLAAFMVTQEFTVQKTAVEVERYGPLEALLVMIVLCFVCIPRLIYWKLIPPIEYGLGYLDLFMLVVCAGALATGLNSIQRSKLYLSPATLLYLASCLLFIVLFYEMQNPMFAMVVFVLYNSELFGRMVLGRMIYPDEVNPHIIPLIVGLVFLQLEPYLYSYELTGYFLALFFIGKHFLLAYYAFMKLRDRHQAMPY